MNSWKWLGCIALASVIAAGCGDKDRFPVSPEAPDMAGQPGAGAGDPNGEQATPGNPNMEQPGAGEPSSGKPSATSLVPVEAAFAGQTQVATSGRYTMVSRVGSSVGAANAHSGSYRLQTGVLALREVQ